MAEKKTLNRRGFRPKKRLGQHFLKEKRVIQEILARSGCTETDTVLEIGAGLGALTLPLAKTVHHLYAVEKDSFLVPALQKKLDREGLRNVTLINQDILRLDIAGAVDTVNGRIKVIGNLPYNISSPLLERLIRIRDLVQRAILMFQLELAGRLTAGPGTKAYGSMTVLMQYHAKISSICKVPRSAFYPQPKVDSMVLEMDFERPHPVKTEDPAGFQRVVRGAFAHRRKTLLNAFGGVFSSSSRDDILKALGDCGIDSGRRAETLSIDDFLCLTRSMASLS